MPAPHWYVITLAVSLASGLLSLYDSEGWWCHIGSCGAHLSRDVSFAGLLSSCS